MSLLSKAKLIPTQRFNGKSEASDEMIELAVAYAKHEVSAKQVAAALGYGKDESAASRAQQKMVHALFSAVRTEKLK